MIFKTTNHFCWNQWNYLLAKSSMQEWGKRCPGKHIHTPLFQLAHESLLKHTWINKILWVMYLALSSSLSVSQLWSPRKIIWHFNTDVSYLCTQYYQKVTRSQAPAYLNAETKPAIYFEGFVLACNLVCWFSTFLTKVKKVIRRIKQDIFRNCLKIHHQHRMLLFSGVFLNGLLGQLVSSTKLFSLLILRLRIKVRPNRNTRLKFHCRL